MVYVNVPMFAWQEKILVFAKLLHSMSCKHDVKHVLTKDQLADIITKALLKPAVEQLQNMMGLRGRQ
jgi:hypothetical protein